MKMLVGLVLLVGCNLDSSLSDEARLISLTPSVGELVPAFDPETSSYRIDLGLVPQDFSITATFDGRLTVDDVDVESDAPSPARPLVLGVNTVTLVVEAPNRSTTRTYLIQVDRGAGLVQQAYVKASNTGAGDGFGGAGLGAIGAIGFGISGDVMAIGAPKEASAAGTNQQDDSAPSAGAVYVMTRSGTTWRQDAFIKAPNAEANDRFGASVAISGDTLVVGAPNEASNATGVDGDRTNNAAAGSGAAYVFVRAGSVWSLQAYLKASNTGAGDQFGFAVAIDGDTIAVGAFGEDSAATGIDGDGLNNAAGTSGAVYVFTRQSGVWSQQAYIKASNTGANDQFGIGVSVDGDTLVVGAQSEDSGDPTNELDDSQPAAGAAYVFARVSGIWSQQAYVKASRPEMLDTFGTSVSVSGDTVVVGARAEDSNATGVGGDEDDNSLSDSGAAYIFTRTGTTWTQTAYLKASNTDSFDLFGHSVSIRGDILCVAAREEASASTGSNGDQANNDATESGAAYVFTRTDGVWSQRAYLKASNTGAGDQFGFTVAVDGTTVAVAAIHEDGSAVGINGNDSDGAMDSGAVYVFQ
jgi:hypothetical protein